MVAERLETAAVANHRGQLGVYLRMNNVEFPGMYGPSADEMKKWQATGA